MNRFLNLLSENRNLISIVAGVVIWRWDDELGRLLITGSF